MPDLLDVILISYIVLAIVAGGFAWRIDARDRPYAGFVMFVVVSDWIRMGVVELWWSAKAAELTALALILA